MTEQAVVVPGRPRWRWLVWLFAALGVAAALSLVWLVVMLNSMGRQYEPAVVAAEMPGERFEVGAVEVLSGTNLVSIEIRKGDREYGSGSIKSGNDNLRNILLLDRNTGESRRLLPDNKVRIGDVRFLPAEAQDDETVYTRLDGSRRQDAPIPVYYLLELVREEQGRRSLALLAGNIAGNDQAIVMEGLAGVERRWMIDNRRLGLIVREGQSLYFRVVDMIDRKVLQSRKIEIG